MNSVLIGLVGEFRALNSIASASENIHLKYLSNFPLKYENSYGQVDVVVVCTKGVFCIEIKDWICKVNCSRNYYWKVTYPSREISVRSPLMQNQAHCSHISNLLCCEVYNIVMFSDEAQLIDPPTNVMHFKDFVPLLGSLPTALAVDDVEKFMEKLAAYKRSIEPDMLADFIFKRLKR